MRSDPTDRCHVSEMASTKPEAVQARVLRCAQGSPEGRCVVQPRSEGHNMAVETDGLQAALTGSLRQRFLTGS